MKHLKLNYANRHLASIQEFGRSHFQSPTHAVRVQLAYAEGMPRLRYRTPARQALARRWVAALRGGKYRQGMTALKRERTRPTYCCLGVYCDLSKAGVWVDCHSGILVYQVGRYESQSELPMPLQQQLALPEPYALLLQYLNDEGATFAQIATVISRWYGL